MAFHLKKVFSSSRSKSSSKDRANEKFTKLDSPSVTTLGRDEAQQAEDTAERKRKAWDAKRAREAEAYLARHGFVS